MGVAALTYLCLALSLFGSTEAPDALLSNELRPPVLLSELLLVAPEGQVISKEAVSVTLMIDEKGQVMELRSSDLLSKQFEWLLLRIIDLKFRPASQQGKPLAVQVPLRLNVEPFPVAKAQLRWRVFE